LIIHRSFVREVLQTVGAVMAILVSIFLAIRVVNILQDAVAGDVPLESIFTILILKLITHFNIIIPLVMFVSVLLVQNRWSRDNEIIIIKACGVSALTFLKPATVLVLIVGIITGVFSLYLGPLSAQIGRNIEVDFRNRSDIAGVVPGVFTETRSGQGVYFVEEFNENIKQYKDVFVYSGGEKEGVVIANNGFKTIDQFTQDEFLVLKDGTRYEGAPGENEYAVMNFETYALRIKKNERAQFAYAVNAYSTKKLFKSKQRAAISELHWRIAHVLAIPIMTLMALSFASSTYRQSRLPGMLMALLTYFAYINFLGVAVSMARHGKIDAHWGLYFVHISFALLALYRFSRTVADKPPIPSIRRARMT
jgi:lipopolysaccharide export system permease protein